MNDTHTHQEQIALQIIQEHQNQYYDLSKARKPEPKRLLDIMLLFSKENKETAHIHSKYRKPLYRYFFKVSEDTYYEQVSNSYMSGVKSKEYRRQKTLKDLMTAIKNKIINDIDKIECVLPNGNDILFHKTKEIPLYLLLRAKRYKDFYVIENKHNQNTSRIGEKIGRDYNTFSLMKSEIRANTDTPYEVDMSSSIQTLILGQYSRIKKTSPKQIKALFPALYNYIHNKTKVREQLASELGITVDKVKKEIQKITFRGELTYKNNKTLKEIERETVTATKEIYSLIKKMEKHKPIAGIIHYILEQTEISKKKKEEKLKRKIKIVFRTKLFFWYEYQEQKIREKMVEYFNDPKTKEVHDAIYLSKEPTPKQIKECQDYVKEKTSFEIML